MGRQRAGLDRLADFIPPAFGWDELVLGEEEHLDWIETQLHAIGDIGIERYLQSQLDA